MHTYLVTNTSSKRLFFRKVTTTDFKDWLPFYENPLSNRYWNGTPTNPEIACKTLIQKTIDRYENGLGGLHALQCKTSNQLIGMCGLLVQEINGKTELEIGYSILPNYWSQGYAFEAAEKCKQLAFKYNWASSLIAIIHIDNIPSQKTALKIGMQIDFRTTYHDNPVYIFRIAK